ncbi:hypothetical protein EXN66_Car012081 [Channa argus]|uniref:Uncharacterized protein n=1 Tax=Channa argus TaxID=215402 RepID=A0A6G1Q1Z5_CHAAH|nr:hypothetical protein EXN66_Car012081 [Channa argus]
MVDSVRKPETRSPPGWDASHGGTRLPNVSVEVVHVLHPRVSERFSHHIQPSLPRHIQPKNSSDYETGPGRTDITCGPVYILAVKAGCSSVLGAILPSIQGEEVTEAPTRQGNMAGYAKYSRHHMAIQLLLTIGSSFTDLIHKDGAGGIFRALF